jgi:cyclic AMP-dependent transcription factor ATF-4
MQFFDKEFLDLGIPQDTLGLYETIDRFELGLDTTTKPNGPNNNNNKILSAFSSFDQAIIDGTEFSKEENPADHSNEFDLTFDTTMSSLLELSEIQEVKPTTQEPKTILADIITSCGIQEEENFADVDQVSVASPASLASDMEQHQSLIDELEDFFMQVDGTPTVVKEEDSGALSLDLLATTTTQSTDPNTILSALATGNVFDNNNILTEEQLNNAYTTSVISKDGENVIIIIAPNSPESSIAASPPSTYMESDSDPEWTPSPSPGHSTSETDSLDTEPSTRTSRKKYSRSKPPKAPSGPYPTEKKERKKAQNRTAAFRYREKKKSEQDVVDSELEALSTKNTILREKLSEMETEFKYLKKLMTEAGLGKYAQVVNL